MNLSNELVSQFVKATKDDKKVSTETTVYGTTVEYNGKIYVKLDGSDLLTPVSKTAEVKDNERVTVMIKDHTATVTGNMSSPAARTDDVTEVADQISEFEIVMAYKVTTEDLEATNATIESLRAKLANITELEAVFADIENLEAKFANLEYVNATDIKAITADIEKIQAHFGTFENISAEDLEALNADIQILRGHTANFTYVSAEVLNAIKASVKELDATKLSAEQAELKYANIDFANIGEAAITKLFSESGIIKDIIVSEGKVTGELVGVTIKGDLIEGNTIKADKLVVKGSDGLYYKLNFEGGNFTEGEVVPDDGLHGSVIVANSITAEKIAVDDLVAFNATIGGFKITNTSIYSGVKESIDNTTIGSYLDKEGQIAIGDASNYLKFYKDTDGKYKLIVSANTMVLSGYDKSVESLIDDTNAINETMQTVHDSLSELAIENGLIKANISNVESNINSVTGELESTKSEIAEMKLTSNQLNIQLESINYNGVSKVVTETGFTFDRQGMTVDSTDSPTKTQVTPDGMTVYTKNADGGQSEVLEATSEGVDATNLHAKTYLIIGGRSRFENYGSNRTGCFWIGG